MGAALVGVDRVGVGVDGVGVGAGPLHRDLDGDLRVGVLGLEGDDVGVDHLGALGRVDELDEVLQAALVEVGDRAGAAGGLALLGLLGLELDVDLLVLLGLVGALVGQRDAQALVEEGHLLEPLAQRLEVVLGRVEDLAVGPEGDRGAGLVGLLALLERGLGHAAGVGLAPDVALAADLDLHADRQGVDHGGAHAVQAAGDGVAAAAELAAGVQHGEHQLDGGLVLGGVHVHGDAAGVVDDAHAAVGEEGDLDGVAVAGHRLVHGVVDDLLDHVVQAALTGGADVHAGALADRLEALEDGDVRGVVVLGRTGRLLARGGRRRGRRRLGGRCCAVRSR